MTSLTGGRAEQRSRQVDPLAAGPAAAPCRMVAPSPRGHRGPLTRSSRRTPVRLGSRLTRWHKPLVAARYAVAGWLGLRVVRGLLHRP